MFIKRDVAQLLGIANLPLNNEGEIIIKSLYHARILAEAIKERLSTITSYDLNIDAPKLYYYHLFQSLIKEIIKDYETNINPMSFQQAASYLYESLGEEQANKTLIEFVELFPPIEVLKGNLTPEEYVERNNKEVVKKIIITAITAQNPVTKDYSETLAIEYSKNLSDVLFTLREFFEKEPPIKDNNKLIEFLHRPLKDGNETLEEQIETILKTWDIWAKRYETELIKCLDAIKEQELFRGPGPGEIKLPSYDISDEENYAPDRSWMTKVVLIAKNTYVWLYQLSKKYNRDIRTLDQIPDEELDYLADLGFNAIWLIGVWERSPASRRIKHLTGNIEAEASAYAIVDYSIAERLGGEQAFINLRDRALKRGIRIGCDMVPNHTAIDSKWIYEHPDWFIQLDHPPFPAYTFNGVNLSSNLEIGIFLEDHYYDRTDAAVVFKRVDYRTNETRYIYHGNDGTSMPWNDTAQLNYLKEEVRNAVINKILEVAELFPIIRFDAAMTLTKFHYQRLWFPEPGKGGAIPSRAEYGMSKEEFDKLMPKEFWREVVDAILKHNPDTLLIAEAFWLLEGYFVRTLGMHRVYNSAFMHMLRDEKNAEYRELIKKTLEYDPEILKRYVNFMSNPDEETAVKQFGKHDKYFGVCTLMVTLPGLPMFAHGQIEGLAEKYGMEYAKSYWEEKEDKELITNHKKIITPLLKKRHLFSEVQNFVFYDFTTEDGAVIEDVFAYSNGDETEKVLVVYNNRLHNYKGTIKNSVPFVRKKDNGKKEIIKLTLAEALGLSKQDTKLSFRDLITGRQYSIPTKEVWKKGITLELRGYEYHVFVDFKEI